MKIKPYQVLLLYLTVILTFAVLFYSIPGQVPKVHGNILESIYFSVVTITTLGYGDIYPHGSFGKLLVSIEAIFGIIIIGLFLSSTWNSLERKYEQMRAQSMKQLAYKDNEIKLSAFYQYLKVLIEEFKVGAAEITTCLLYTSPSPRD